MVLMGMDVPLAAIQRQIASAIDIIIHIGRLWDKSRKLLEIVEVMDYNGEEIDTRILYQFEETGREHGRIAGKWKKVQDLANTESYFRQDIRRSEYASALFKTVSLQMLLAYLFYESKIAFIILTPVGVWYFLHWEVDMINQKRREFQEQFREAIQSLAASLQVGYSIENAMKETKKDLSILYKEDTAIQREFTHMVHQIYLQIPAERILEEWAERVEQEDVRNFVNVFVMARRSGGNMIGIIRNTAGQIRDKLEVRAEIETMLAARKYEFKVMAVIPFVMIAYMKFSFPEFMKILYGNPTGIGVMTACLAIYFGAYLLGEKIVNIEV